MKTFGKLVPWLAMGTMLAACSSPPATKPTASVAPPVYFRSQPIMGDSAPATQPDQAPAAQPDLPPGHPDLSKLMPADEAATLPPGHPGIGAMAPATMPSDHSTSVGTLTVRAVQKTQGAAPVGTAKFDLELYVKGQLWDKLSTKLGSDGTISLPGIPLQFGVQPLVKISYAGATYAAVGDVMDFKHPTQTIEVPVYEAAQTAPDWSVMMRHVIMHPGPTGIDVVEMLAIRCAGDHSWNGDADSTGKRITLSLPLPDGVKDLRVGGNLSADAITLDGNVLRSSQPITPGQTDYQLQYTVPAIDGKLSFSVSASAKMGHVLVFIPDDGSTVTPTAPLQLMGSQQMGENGPKTRYFMATQVDAGQKLTLSISNLNSAPATGATGATGTADPAPQSEQSAAPPIAIAASTAPKAVVLVGLALVLAIGSVTILIRGPRAAANSKK